jgi:uncharacterized protein (DUF488 family)
MDEIAVLVDVRSFPSSRRWPHFNQEPLAASLIHAGIEYRWCKNLGGRRHRVLADSPHTAWEHPAFRAYADYADTADFHEGLDELITVAQKTRLAYMCSEGLWWRCHRRIISDHLTLRGWRIEHILPDGKLKPHVLAPFARIVEGKLIYDGAESKDANHQDIK